MSARHAGLFCFWQGLPISFRTIKTNGIQSGMSSRPRSQKRSLR